LTRHQILSSFSVIIILDELNKTWVQKQMMHKENLKLWLSKQQEVYGVALPKSKT
jgi:dsDNA-binding SOS-regulon protein